MNKVNFSLTENKDTDSKIRAEKVNIAIHNSEM